MKLSGLDRIFTPRAELQDCTAWEKHAWFEYVVLVLIFAFSLRVTSMGLLCFEEEKKVSLAVDLGLGILDILFPLNLFHSNPHLV
jgi:hypothetical protein